MAAEWRAAQPPSSSSSPWGGGNRAQHHHRNHHQSSSWNSKPPLPPGSNHCSVPLWEKKFVNEVGTMSWKKLCENQRFMGFSNNVIEWDDSAALESFQKSKARFRAKYFGFSCDIPLPDPNMYLDEIDFNAFIDPELVEDLEKCRLCLATAVDLSSDGFVHSTDLPVVLTGWGDAEDVNTNNSNDARHLVEQPIQYQAASGWGTAAVSTGCNVNQGYSDAWNNGGMPYTDLPVVPTGWGDAEEPVTNSIGAWDHLIEQPNQFVNASGWGTAAGPDSSGWNAKHGNNNAWNVGGALSYEADQSWSNWRNNNGNNDRSVQWDNRNWEPGRRRGRKRDASWNGSRIMKTKYEDGVYNTNSSWRNCRGKNSTSYQYEKVKQPLAW